jgi:hypothetical protein
LTADESGGPCEEHRTGHEITERRSTRSVAEERGSDDISNIHSLETGSDSWVLSVPVGDLADGQRPRNRKPCVPRIGAGFGVRIVCLRVAIEQFHVIGDRLESMGEPGRY